MKADANDDRRLDVAGQKPKGVSRRSFLTQMSVAASGALLAACGGSAPTVSEDGAANTASDRASAPAAGSTPVELRWSMWAATPEETAVWQGLADDVSAVYPNITIKLETTAFNDYWDKLQTQLASSTEADVVAMQSLRMPPFAARNALRPLEPFMEQDADFKLDDFFPAIRNGLSANGNVYGLAYDLGPIMLYYNLDMFKAAGVEPPSPTEPMTWEVFRDKAKQLTKPDAGEYGFVIQPTFDSSVPWLWSGGGDYMNEAETETLIDSPDSVAALNFMVGLITKDKCAAPITDLANANFASEQFYSGKIGMTPNGPWNFVNVRKNAGFKWDIAPLPAGKAGSVTWVAGSGFGISNTTQHPEEAWLALKTITSTESLEKTAKAGRGYPGRQSAVPAFIDRSLAPENVDTVAGILTNELAQSRFYRTTTTWQEIAVMMTQEFNPVYLGQQSVEETVARVAPKFNELLAKHQSLLNS